MARAEKKEWPGWRYHPTEGGRIFERPEDVPPGWVKRRQHAEAIARGEVDPPEEEPKQPAVNALERMRSAQPVEELDDDLPLLGDEDDAPAPKKVRRIKKRRG
jgi:hypothetical protein